ncbi:MAG: ATP-binding cassette domain-containing protein, partial [Butyricicoccus porcorum]
MSLLGAAVSFIAFAYCLFLLWTKSISYGTMTLFLQQRAKLSSDFNSLIGIFPSMLNSAVSAQRVRELLELPKEEHALETTHQLEELADDGFTVCMRGVYFSYTESSSVLTDSDFLACPNEIVALVGPSGEGKTTMLRMILGLIHPDGGTAVLIDSTGNEIPMNADLRRFFSYVPQGNTIVSGTIAENLRMVREDATDEQIIDALKIACAWDFVRNLPDGIHSPLGERGRRVSEGQAQRIAIARAVLRDCPILLLDEATSALDVETERRVLKNIIRQRPNKTCIVTTHRPSVLGMCRRVYRVKNTRVTELGEEESARLVQDW